MSHRYRRAPTTLPTLEGKGHDDIVEAIKRLQASVDVLHAEPIPFDPRPGFRIMATRLRSLQVLLQSTRNQFKKVEEEVFPPTLPVRGGGITGGGTTPFPPPPPSPPPEMPPPGDPNNPPPLLPLPNYFGVVSAYFASHPTQVAQSCQSAGGNWNLMDGLVDTLRASDARFGYNGKRGNCGDPSNDAISYYWGPGGAYECAGQVYVVDVISGHCGPNPGPAWNDVTQFGPGAWISRGRF